MHTPTPKPVDQQPTAEIQATHVTTVINEQPPTHSAAIIGQPTDVGTPETTATKQPIRTITRQTIDRPVLCKPENCFPDCLDEYLNASDQPGDSYTVQHDSRNPITACPRQIAWDALAAYYFGCLTGRYCGDGLATCTGQIESWITCATCDIIYLARPLSKPEPHCGTVKSKRYIIGDCAGLACNIAVALTSTTLGCLFGCVHGAVNVAHCHTTEAFEPTEPQESMTECLPESYSTTTFLYVHPRPGAA